MKNCKLDLEREREKNSFQYCRTWRTFQTQPGIPCIPLYTLCVICVQCTRSHPSHTTFYVFSHQRIQYLWHMGFSANHAQFPRPLQLLTSLPQTQRRTQAFLKLAISLHTLGNVARWQTVFVVGVGRCWNWLSSCTWWDEAQTVLLTGPEVERTILNLPKISPTFDRQAMRLLPGTGCGKGFNPLRAWRIPHPRPRWWGQHDWVWERLELIRR